ncbi:hypothetical protein BDW02DRAFT_385685 [Decorospora gaudefroyi]|uniref:Uncharacterized protein n=1 Tax=Decorospora gaudefroyi TaxID=184978 RepID=A0A6A5KBP1_9PLEO|nr:hypothetical protein BDW02DRAFT_385685 [Decorospora gaudefroyi]
MSMPFTAHMSTRCTVCAVSRGPRYTHMVIHSLKRVQSAQSTYRVCIIAEQRTHTRPTHPIVLTPPSYRLPLPNNPLLTTHRILLPITATPVLSCPALQQTPPSSVLRPLLLLIHLLHLYHLLLHHSLSPSLLPYPSLSFKTRPPTTSSKHNNHNR